MYKNRKFITKVFSTLGMLGVMFTQLQSQAQVTSAISMCEEYQKGNPATGELVSVSENGILENLSTISDKSKYIVTCEFEKVNVALNSQGKPVSQ
jgi:hypothetical protein